MSASRTGEQANQLKTSDSVVIRSAYERIFELAANVEEWARILPHYRYVNVLKRNGNSKLVRMSAWRDFMPVTWSAIETIYPGTELEPGRITFHHVRGMVKGMDVEWSFRVRKEQGDVLVTISHDLRNPPFPVRILGPKLTDVIVGRGFIGNIAGKTLRGIKILAESET
jgi:ribosome-associated toxin RatA of RatAB toxin-antitoxin module